MKIVTKIQNPKIENQVITGFLGGLNSFQDDTQIKDSELTEAKNIMLEIDGITIRPGTENYGTSSGTGILGGIGFYKSDGTREFLRYAKGANNKLQKYVGGTPTDIGATTYNATARMNFVQARDKVYIFNGQDALSYYDGSTITTYSALTTPEGLTVTPTFVETIGVTSITRSSTTATCTHAGATTFYLKTGDYVTISGAAEAEYNGKFQITVTSSTTFTYTVSGTPATPATGTVKLSKAGVTSYSYRVSAFNAVGETLACTSVAVTTGPAELDSGNYNALAWTAVSGATGYNIYGNKATGLGETYMKTVYTNSYEDKGTEIPSLSMLVPEGNTTTGVKGTMAIFAISRIFVSGDPAYPSRLYFGGTADQIGNFSASSIGGGGVDVFRNDGSIIRAILPFQGGVIIWKDNAIYKFSFATDGTQMLEEITRSFGGISFRSCKHVENDIIFAAKKDGRLAFYSLGNQENYTASVLRTNELSIKVSEKLENVNLAYLQHSAAFYFNNLYGCAIPKSGSSVNNMMWLLDTRFGAWVYWEGIRANFFTEYTDTDGTQKLYAGSESTGYMIEMFTDTRLDNGSAIEVEWATKAFNQKLFHKFKRFLSPVMQFKDVSKAGSLIGEIYLDGAILSSQFTVNQQTQGGAGIGVYFFGQHLFGEAHGSEAITGLSSDILVEVRMRNVARSIKFIFKSETAADVRYKFLSLAIPYMVLDGMRLRSTSVTYPS